MCNTTPKCLESGKKGHSLYTYMYRTVISFLHGMTKITLESLILAIVLGATVPACGIGAYQKLSHVYR